MYDWTDSEDGDYSASSISGDSLSEEEQVVQDLLVDDENDSDYYVRHLLLYKFTIIKFLVGI